LSFIDCCCFHLLSVPMSSVASVSAPVTLGESIRRLSNKLTPGDDAVYDKSPMAIAIPIAEAVDTAEHKVLNGVVKPNLMHGLKLLAKGVLTAHERITELSEQVVSHGIGVVSQNNDEEEIAELKSENTRLLQKVEQTSKINKELESDVGRLENENKDLETENLNLEAKYHTELNRNDKLTEDNTRLIDENEELKDTIAKKDGLIRLHEDTIRDLRLQVSEDANERLRDNSILVQEIENNADEIKRLQSTIEELKQPKPFHAVKKQAYKQGRNRVNCMESHAEVHAYLQKLRADRNLSKTLFEKTVKDYAGDCVNHVDDFTNASLSMAITHGEYNGASNAHARKFHNCNFKEGHACVKSVFWGAFPMSPADLTEEQMTTKMEYRFSERKYATLMKVALKALYENLYSALEKSKVFVANTKEEPFSVSCVNHPMIVRLFEMNTGAMKAKINEIIRTVKPDYNIQEVYDNKKRKQLEEAEEKKKSHKKNKKEHNYNYDNSIAERVNENAPSVGVLVQNGVSIPMASESSTSSSSSVGVVSENNEKSEDDLFDERPIQEKDDPAPAVAVVEENADSLC